MSSTSSAPLLPSSSASSSSLSSSPPRLASSSSAAPSSSSPPRPSSSPPSTTTTFPPAATMLPIVVYPNKITFESNDQASFRQLFTVYNPMDFALNYKVLSTFPKAYYVKPPKGTIKPRSSTDIVVRLKEFSNARQDKFMVKITGMNEAPLGTKFVVAELKWSRGPDPGESSSKKQSKHEEKRPEHAVVSPVYPQEGRWKKMLVFFLIVGILGTVVVILDPSWIVYSTNFSSLSTAQQLVIAFLLGMVAMVFLKDLL